MHESMKFAHITQRNVLVKRTCVSAGFRLSRQCSCKRRVVVPCPTHDGYTLDPFSLTASSLAWAHKIYDLRYLLNCLGNVSCSTVLLESMYPTPIIGTQVLILCAWSQMKKTSKPEF